ncbi:MAG: flagellar basal body protein [Aurantimonas endophytica]|uniref:Flagellar basal-body rod protein FlgB n=2 Tax=Aurantimonas endophytica TaxID=1522175 RepID=A0A7W6HGY0_9HYPH|nr:flagellar basal body protein [Aurantimonas endophytica]MBB4005031.1 flagellar basal-body rod protein FlgB [Aurantimonas endophytica]MCO6405837.1 flagellar basal body rod protein FlgB [Aurantimonas endophytica]
MDQVYLFGIASQRSSWLANRQTVVAENIANASTPGYTSKDLASFSEVLDTTGLQLSQSSDMHLASLGRRRGEDTTVSEDSWDVRHSGNSVMLEQEMLKAGEISRGYALNTSVMKAFQRLLVMSVKG